MSIIVWVSGPLRQLTKGKTEIELAASDVADCINKLESQFPGVREQVCDETGEIRGSVNIYVNGDNVNSLQCLTTSVKAGDEVTILPAAAAG
jgi:molybdopterin synthase sulfur carrier subunit